MATKTVNKITLIGKVGRDPDIQGDSAHFSLATTRPGPDDESFTRHDWHRIAVSKNERQVRFVQDYVRVGDRLYVEGTLVYDSYERDGIIIPTATIEAREIVRLTNGEEGS